MQKEQPHLLKSQNIFYNQIKVYVQELSDRYQVSSVTIRNDLEVLNKKGLLLETRGGAIKTESRVRSDQNISEKYNLNIQKNEVLGSWQPMRCMIMKPLLLTQDRLRKNCVKTFPIKRSDHHNQCN